MPNLRFHCDVCDLAHLTCDAAAKCERAHPPGSTRCDQCDGTGEWRYTLDRCDDCKGKGVVPITVPPGATLLTDTLATFVRETTEPEDFDDNDKPNEKKTKHQKEKRK